MTPQVTRRLFVSALSPVACAALAAFALAGCTRESPKAEGATISPAGSASGNASAAAPAKPAGPLTVKGSDTMVGLSQKWAEVYMAGHAGTSIQVTGGGTGTGIAALVNGGTDLCNASRPLSDKEKADIKGKRGADAVETRVALDALAVYVNEKSPVQEMDLETLAQIYLGKITDWKDVPGGKAHKITLYGRENNSGTYGYFKEHVLAKKDFAPEVQTLSGTAAVASAVKGDEFGIGYGGIAYSGGIHLLKIKKTKADPAVEPKESTAIDGSYPISRFLYIDTAGAPSGTAKQFIDWILTEDGQKVVNDVGYFKLPK
jgi:phosphate transport system substrate-binding protein